MNLPSLTPAQIKADIIFILGVAASLGLRIDGDTSNAITVALVGIFGAVKSVTYLVDMLLRKHRAEHALAIAEAQKLTAKK